MKRVASFVLFAGIALMAALLVYSSLKRREAEVAKSAGHQGKPLEKGKRTPEPRAAVEPPPPIKEKIVLRGVHFGPNKAIIRPGDAAVLNETANTLKAHPNLSLHVNGYGDQSGSEEYNLRLSQRRSDAVASYLIQQGVSPNRLIARGYGKSDFVASNDTDEGKTENRRVELVPVSSSASSAPPAMVSGYWSPWIADMYTKDATSNTLLTNGKPYIVHFDLAAYSYSVSGQEIEIDPQLQKVLTKFAPNVPVTLRVLPVITGRSVKLLSGWPLPNTVLIDVDKLRNPPQARYSNEPLARFAKRSAAASISIHLDAVQTGCSTVSVSIWNEMANRPVDNVGIRLAVADSEGKAPVCYSGSETPVVYGHLSSLFDQEPGHRVDAALHIFGIDNEDFAVFKTRDKDFLVWKLRQPILGCIDNPAALPRSVISANGKRSYADLYLEFTKDIFASEDPKGNASALAALDQIRSIANKKENPAFFGRLVDSNGRPFILPLGLIALDNTGKSALGSKCQIVQPLPEEQPVRKAKCIDTWRLVLPVLITDGKSSTNTPMPSVSSIVPDLSSDRIKTLENWPEFDLYMNSVLAAGPLPAPVSSTYTPEVPEGLLLLAHQDNEIISFLPGGTPPHAQASDLHRSYASGSIAILFVCGTGLFDYGHGNPDISWIDQLNRKGVSTIIVSPFSIPLDDGTALARRLADEINRLDPKKGVTSLSELWSAAFAENASKTRPVADDADLGIVSEFVTAGDSDVKFCGR
jgi:outer membrane protein OmpA-like peptidoglycan-associated protein